MYTYRPVKHWWDLPANDPCSLIVRKLGRLHLAAASVGVPEATFKYWHTHGIPATAWAGFQKLGVSAARLQAHNKQYLAPRLGESDYQRYYYITVTKRKRHQLSGAR